MAEQDDVLHLIDDTGTVPDDSSVRKWKIAVIDDDQAVHEGTRFALSDYVLNGQGLEILSAYSAAEGRELMRAHKDIAAVLLDVIMETDVAGLELVEFIRNEIQNETVRIILRTGQPGQAPERRVIVQYDINDYKAKTELTADKLFTSLTAALRSYQQLERMVQTRRGLEIIIDAASTLYDFKSMQRLAEGVLTQLASLLNVDCAGILVLRDDGSKQSDELSVLAGSGCYSRFIGAASSRSLDPDLRAMVEAAFKRRKHEFADHRTVLYVRTGSRPRGRGAAAGRAAIVGDRPLAGGDLRQPPVDRLRQRHPLSAASRGQHPARGPRRPAHPRADAGQPPAVGAMAAAAARQRLQERNPGHRRPRPEESARRHPRPHRDADRADLDRGLEGKRHRPDRPHPRRHQAPDLDGRPSDLGCDGGRLRHHHPPRAGRRRRIS